MIFNWDFVWVGIMQIFGFFVQGCTGFGCTVLAAPVTNGLLGTAVGVPYGTLMTLPFLIGLAFFMWRDVSWKDLLKIVILCAPGLILGNYLFYKMSAVVAKICIGTIVTLIASANIYKVIIKPFVLKKEVEEDAPDTTVKKAFRYGCLIVGGIVHGAFNIGGPMITVYTLEAVKDKEKFRNTMTMLWIVLNLWNASSQYMNGAWNATLWSALAIGFPMAAVGFIFGVKFLKRINREQFLRIVYVLLLFIGVSMLFTSLKAVM